MSTFLEELKNALTGDYPVETTPTVSIEPTPYDVAYSVTEMNEVFERGLTGNPPADSAT